MEEAASKDISEFKTVLIPFIQSLKNEKFIFKLKELLSKAHKLEEIKNSRILSQTNQREEGEKKFNKAKRKFLAKCLKNGVKITEDEVFLTSENLAPLYYLSFNL